MLCLPGAGLANFMPQGKLNNAETIQQSNQISGEKADPSIRYQIDLSSIRKKAIKEVNGDSSVTDDTSGPVLEYYTVAPKEVTVGDTFFISAKVSDESGVSQVIAKMYGASTKEIPLTYNSDTGLWEVYYKIEPYDFNGAWVLTFRMYDMLGNLSGKLTYETIYVTNPDPSGGDWIPPYIEEITIDPEIVNPGQPFTFHAKIVEKYVIKSVEACIWSQNVCEEKLPVTYDPERDEWIGTYTFPLTTPPGTKSLYISATDGNGNNSREEPKSFEVTDDITPPTKPAVHEVTDKDTSVTGEAEANSKVEVKANGAVIGSTLAATDSTFTVAIPVQKPGVELTVTATDKAGNVSEAAAVVVKDVTPPAMPAVHEVTDKDSSVTGFAEAGSTVEVTANGTVIGTAAAGADGALTVTIPVQKAGIELKITATDKAKNRSEAAAVTVKDVTPPAMPIVNEVTDKDSSVTGFAEEGSKVEVKANDKIIGSAISGTDGTFKVTIPIQKPETILKITATDEAKNMSEAANAVVKDVTAPDTPIVKQVTETDTYVTGTSEAGTKIDVKKDGMVIGTGITGENNIFVVAIPVQKAGTRLTVTATDKANHVSGANSIMVIDVTAPEKPVVNEVTDKDTSVTGQAEPEAWVYVRTNETLLGYGYVNEGGKFAVTISAQTVGTKLSITVTDPFANISEAVTVTVTAAKPSGWVKENGTWYYYDPNTYEKKTDWVKVGGTWYYFNEKGARQTGWQKIRNVWYYFNTSGEMQTGWVKSGSSWYYLNASGATATGWVKSGSSWYYLNPSGAMATGWVKSGSSWYYLNASGAMVTGWVKNGSSWYYLSASGAMATGWVTISGKSYYFYNNGVLK